MESLDSIILAETETEKILRIAKERLKMAVDADNHNRLAALEDLRFLNGEQWDSSERQKRTDRGRPCLQINVLPKFVKQICGEMRKNKVQIKVRPIDSQADMELAKIREGMIYSIEYLSNAESIYDYAGEMLVRCGYGAWRVLTRYVENEDNPFMQEICLERIDNPLSVYMDVESRDKNFADARWGFILSKMSRRKFEEEFGKDKIPGGGIITGPIGTTDEYWWDKDNVTIAEYFDTEYETKQMCKLSDGQSLEEKDATIYIESAKDTFSKIGEKDPTIGAEEELIPYVVQKREVKIPKIKWRKITASHILDEKDWAGSIIPIILVTGEEMNIGGKKYIKGLIRDAKDPQRLLNYWHTNACETIALAPKTPWMATPRMIEGFEEDYDNAHLDNLPVLHYNPDPDFPQERPERIPSGQPPVAIFTEIGRAEQSIKDTIGMYNTDVGDTTDEHLRDVSGRAITARQQPGDNATFVYLDNMAQGIAHGGKIVNDLIPKINVEPRSVRMRRTDGSETFAPINTTVGEALDTVKSNPQKFGGMDVEKLQKTMLEKGADGSFNDITQGKYDIAISTGPTFATQRAEAVENIVRIATAVNMNPVDKYFIIKNSDFPGSDEYAEVIKRTIPPGVLPPEEGGAPMPQGPNTAEQLDMQKIKLDEMKARTEQMKLQLQIVKLKKEIEGDKGGVRKEILGMLQELNAPEHPADLMGGMQQ